MKSNVHKPIAIGDEDETVIATGILWLRWREIGCEVMDIIYDCDDEEEIHKEIRRNLGRIAEAAIRAKGLLYRKDA